MRLLAAIVVALVLAAVAQAKQIPHVCALLTDAQVQHAVGQKVEYRQPHLGACTWHTAPLSSFTSASPDVFVQVAPVTEAKFKRIERDEGGTPVKGVATVAYWLPYSQVRELLAWQRGYSISVYVIEVPSQLKAERELALEALARLP
jgi:hypothetical protein